MKFRLLLILTLLSMVLANADENRPNDDPFSVKDLTQDQQTVFLYGIGQALTVYDLKLGLQGKPRLFCAPANLSLDAKMVWTLANGALAGPHSSDIVAIAVVDELTRKFPCEPKSEEELELERLNEALRMIDTMKSTIEEKARERYAQCLRLTSSTTYCDCLNDKLSWQIKFEVYEHIASTTKSELEYDELPHDDRELVDHIYSVRDGCAKTRGSP